jgi:hypothetical protein
MRAIMEHWNQLSPPEMIGREAERAALIEALQRPGSIVELVAPVGMGKTTLLKRVSLDAQASFGGAVEYFTGSDDFPLSQAVDVIAENFEKARGHSLLVIDGADLLKRGDTLEAIGRLSTGHGPFRPLSRVRLVWVLATSLLRCLRLPARRSESCSAYCSMGPLTPAEWSACGEPRVTIRGLHVYSANTGGRARHATSPRSRGALIGVRSAKQDGREPIIDFMLKPVESLGDDHDRQGDREKRHGRGPGFSQRGRPGLRPTAGSR